MKSRYIFPLILLVITIIAQSVPAQAGDSGTTLSGFECLQLVYNRYGIKSSVGALSAETAKSKKSVSIHALAMAARSKGLNTSEVKLGVDELVSLKIPAIVLLWSGSYVVVENGGMDTLKITYPSNPEVRYMPKVAFKNLSTGLTLLAVPNASDLPEFKPQDADARFDCLYYDFGKVEQGTKVKQVIKFKNLGSKPLTVSLVRASCACTKASKPDKSIAPGGKGELMLEFDTTGRAGVQSEIVYVHSNDPVTPFARIKLTGVVLLTKIAAYPRAINYGVIAREDITPRHIFITDPEEINLQVKSAISSSPYVTCRITPEDDRGRKRYKITVLLDTTMPAGDLNTKISIQTTHPREPVVEIPLTATIK